MLSLLILCLTEKNVHDMDMSSTIDIISQLRRKDGSFSAQEQKVADHILENLEQAVHMTLTEIANASDVSVATVNRFCRSLGCEGFKEFKIRLAQNVAVSLQYLNNSTGNDTVDGELTNYIFDVATNALNQTRNQLDPKVIESAISALVTCKRLVFIGVGGSSSNIAAEGVNRFFRLGIHCDVTNDGYVQRMTASTMGEGEIIFAISSTGWPQELLDSVEIARQYGVTTICLTQGGSPLAQACDIALTVDFAEDNDIFKPSPIRYVFTAILDILATGVARKRPNRTRESLRRIRASLVALHKRTQPQPVGD
jgi:RpiR family carbohydrate utilization transcriptional regulator